MSEAIFTAELGLRAYEAGLQAISNDSDNLNTLGYKGSTVLFSDLIGGNNEEGGGDGQGVTTTGTTLNFSAGTLQSDGNPLDLALSGNGFFTLRDSNGTLHYTQDGQFQVNSSGILVSDATGEDVMARGSNGELTAINVNNFETNAGAATTAVTFSGNVLSTSTTASTISVPVFDNAGNAATLSVSLTPVSGTPGSFTATVTDGTTTVGTGTIAFDAGGQPVSGSDTLAVSFTPPGGTASPLTLDFSQTTSNATGTASTLAVATSDGHASGTLEAGNETFDSEGNLILSYSNGQTAMAGQLALAAFASPGDLTAVSSNEFTLSASGKVQVGVAASNSAFGTVESGEVEGSNVDLSQEFSELVVMQRGYQASSQCISTASDMLSSLFDIRQGG